MKKTLLLAYSSLETIKKESLFSFTSFWIFDVDFKQTDNLFRKIFANPNLHFAALCFRRLDERFLGFFDATISVGVVVVASSFDVHFEVRFVAGVVVVAQKVKLYFVEGGRDWVIGGMQPCSRKTNLSINYDCTPLVFWTIKWSKSQNSYGSKFIKQFKMSTFYKR